VEPVAADGARRFVAGFAWQRPVNTQASARAVGPRPSAVAGNTLVDQPGLFDDGCRSGEALEVPIVLLDDDPAHPRTETSKVALAELAQDIAERGVLQPIIVAAPDAHGRYRIRIGGQRWRAARLAGLATVPVVLRSQACDAYDQVAENLKRCALSPLDLARFIQGRAAAGESNAFIAKRLAIDATTVAHHLTLLQLSPELEAVRDSGRCTSPRTLHELQLLQAEEPQAVAALLAAEQPLTRDAVAAARTNSRPQARHTPPSPPQLLDRTRALCDRLDRVLAQLVVVHPDQLPAEQLAALRERLVALAQRLAG
jgi:ParB family transcriptional regulator, chromosome partitioning protein